MRKPLFNAFLQSNLDGNRKDITNIRNIPGFLPIVRMKDFGAIKNGSGDNAAALTAAIAAVASLGSAEIHFDPDGTYQFTTQPVTIGYVACAVSVAGFSSTSRLKIVGNGAKITTTLATGALIGIDTAFDSIEINGLTFTRPSIVHQYPTSAIYLNSSFGPAGNAPTPGPKSKLFLVEDCHFINMDRSVMTPDGGIMARRGNLELFIFRNNRQEHPFGTNSTDTTGRPRVGIILNNWAKTAVFDDNYFDGGSVITALDTPNLSQKDGFFIAEGRNVIARNNTVKNFAVEGLFSATQGSIGLITAPWTAPDPDIPGIVTVTYNVLPENVAAYMGIGQLLWFSNQNDLYNPMGIYSVVSVNPATNSMVIFNENQLYNAAPGTTTPFSFFGPIDPEPNAVTIFTGNDMDQRFVPNGPIRTNPCLAAYKGVCTIRGNTLRNVYEGISLGGAGENELSRYPKNCWYSVIEGNSIYMDELNLTNQGSIKYGIIAAGSRQYVDISNNSIYCKTSKGVWGIANGPKGTTRGNVIRAEALVYDAAFLSYGIIMQNGCPGQVLLDNHVENMDNGIEFQPSGGGYSFAFAGLTTVNVKNPYNKLPDSYQCLDRSEVATTRFTPTAIGWHRISIGNGFILAGRLTIEASTTAGDKVECCADYSIVPYGGGSSLSIVRGSLQNTPPVSKIRVSSDGGAGLFLDIYVPSVTTPASVFLNFSGPKQGIIVNTPVALNPQPGAGTTDAKEAIIGLGLRSPNFSTLDGVQIIGARGAAVANATDAATAITQLNLVLDRMRAHGLIA